MRRLSAVFSCLCLVLATACAQDRAIADWIAEAHAAHRTADRALKAGDSRAARDALEFAALTAAPRGAPDQQARAIRKDLMYRLAVLELEDRKPERALDWASRGLALGESDDVFTANLRIVRGRAHEALGDRGLASADYHAALLISERLLDDALEGKGK